MVHYLEKEGSPVNSWYTRAGMEWTGKKGYWPEEGGEAGEGGAEGCSATGDGGRAAGSHLPGVDGAGSGLDIKILDFCNLHSCCSVTQLCPTLWDPTDCSTPGFFVLHCLPELAQTHVHWVSGAIQPSDPPYSTCTVKHTQAQPLVEDARSWQGTPDLWTHSRDWTSERAFASLKVCSLKVRMQWTYSNFLCNLTLCLGTISIRT